MRRRRSLDACPDVSVQIKAPFQCRPTLLRAAKWAEPLIPVERFDHSVPFCSSQRWR